MADKKVITNDEVKVKDGVTVAGGTVCIGYFKFLFLGGFFERYARWIAAINGDVAEYEQIVEEQMAKHYEFFGQFQKENQYVKSDSILQCSGGTKLVKFDVLKNHGVVEKDGTPLGTCFSCKENQDICPFGCKMARVVPIVKPNTLISIKKCIPNLKRGWNNNAKTVACAYNGFISVVEAPENKNSFVEWLSQIEAPYLPSDYIVIDEKKIAIKPHNANDGFVTVGYGHCIQSDIDAQKYGFKSGSKQDVNTVTDVISKQLDSYESYKDNPAILTFQVAEDLLIADLVDYQTKASNIASATGLTFSQNEMAGITSLVYNGNRVNDPDSLLYHFLRKDKNGAMDVLHKAVDNGWYGSNRGLLRRRLMEFNIFFNNDYTFYDFNELKILKDAVGFVD